MTKKRCFLGVRLPAITQFYERIRAISKDMNIKISTVKPHFYHFTLHFFGDITDDQIEQINRRMQTIQQSAFSIKLNEFSFFPANRSKKARILYVATTEGEGRVITLHSKVIEEVDQLGFKTESRKYIPHLTVARIRHGRDRGQVAQDWEDTTDLYTEKIPVDSFSLMKSDLTPKGPEYTDIQQYMLE